MPSFSQLFGVNKGSNSPNKNRQGFFPFGRKWPSASFGSRGRQHLRTKSDNTVVCYGGGGGITRSADFSKRSSPVAGHSRDQRESYESRYERYRQIYETTSPERELSTLNAAIVNVRKWLKKKHECLQQLQHSYDAKQRQRQQQEQQEAENAAAAAATEQQSPQKSGDCGAGLSIADTDNKLQTDQDDDARDKQALLEKLVSEAGDQQEAVDVLLDRGRRYLVHRACITLEVDLDNLAFLWNAYTKQLHLLHHHQQFDDPLRSDFLVDDVVGAFACPDGKENLILHSTPTRWKKGPGVTPDRLYSSSEKLHSPFTPERQSLSAESDKQNIPTAIANGIAERQSSSAASANSTAEKQRTAHTTPDVKQQLAADFSSERNGSVPDCENSYPSFAKSDKRELISPPTPDHFDTEKKEFSPSDTTLTDGRFAKETSEKEREKPDGEASIAEKDSEPAVEGSAPVKTRRKLPPIPTERDNRKNKEPATEKGEEPESRLKTRGKKPSSPLSERTKVINASLRPGSGGVGGSNSGWLKIPGDGIFTGSSRGKRRTTIALHKVTSDYDSSPSEQNLNSDGVQDIEQPSEVKASAPESNAAASSADRSGTPPSSKPGIKRFNSNTLVSPNVAAEEASLLKRSKEIHNERQQQQELQQQQQLGSETQQSDINGSSSAQFPGILLLPSGLTESEENLKMEIEEALKEINGSLDHTSESLMDLTDSDSTDKDRDTDTGSAAQNASPKSKTPDRDSLFLDDLDFPTASKRRRMNADTSSSVSSCSGSPLVSGESSATGTPTSSPAGSLRRDYKQRYKKDELWKAIESNYKYLMDKEIIETCQSTDKEPGPEEEEEVDPNVSFAEFLKQYQELIDWLNQAQRNTQRDVNSLSEKYLNQTYHEEMLEKSPRREFLHKYAHQLLVRYPNLSDQVNLRMQRLNSQWSTVEAAISPQHGLANTDSMLQDLECDLSALRRWLNATESRLLPLTIKADWTDAELQDRLKQHQVLQQDIESHSRIVSAVLKLSERVEQERVSKSCGKGPARHCDSLQLVALNLERRWHGIWLQSLEWQCRLEEAIQRRKGLYGSGFNFSSFNLPTLDESCSGGGSDLDLPANSNVTDCNSSNGSLIELSDDSLLFIGTRSDRYVEESSPNTSSTTTLTPPSLTFPSPKLTNFLDRSSGDSANISECESKMGDSPRGVEELSSLSQGRADLSLNEPETEVRGRMMKTGQDSRDVGYSSESQSNDETESMQQQIAMECRYPGLIEVSSDSPLGERVALPAPGGVRQDYYCMTHVDDLDSTTTNTTDNKTTTEDDGNTTDDKENLHGKKAVLRLPNKENDRAGEGVLREAGSAVKSQNLLGGSSSQESSLGAVGTNSALRGSHEDIEVKSWLESSDEFDVARKLGSEELRLHLHAEANETLSLFHQHLVGSESDSATESQEKIRYLIEHAEDLVKTSPRSPTATLGSPKRKMSPSKQTQTVATTTTSTVESSCDASSENSDDEVDEFSTATDDADETLFDSVINLDSTTESLNSREELLAASFEPSSSAVPIDSARLRKQTGPRSGKKDRPWSVVGFQDLKKMDFHPLSTSESAIDRMRPHTDTDSSSTSTPFLSVSQASTFPRRTPRTRGGLQRAASACEETATSSSSPRSAAKRKLKYSSSSSATDSQTSKSSATHVALSTEEDGDEERTFVYDSVDQSRTYSAGRPPCLLESESETTDEYLTASMDEVVTSADEDPHNSTGSFSENAWDNYQMMYPPASENATEEQLHWEPVDDMEFDDDFNFIFPNTSSLLSDAISKTANKLKLLPSGGHCEDSDSDMEDFRSVLEDTENCLKVVDHSLRKKRTNSMGTGLASHGKYAEILATCETNISCVKNVCQVLTQDDIGINDLKRVQDLLYRWEKLHALAATRHQQAQQLNGVCEALKTMKGTLTDASKCLSFELFNSKEELETTIITLRMKGDQLDKQRQVIKEHQKVINSFLEHHPTVNVSKFVDELEELDKSTAETQEKVSSHLLNLENNWAVWCHYLDGQQELDTLMAADRERLYTLLCQREAGHRVTKKDVLKELETLQNKLGVYEDKLSLLQAMRQRLMKVSDDSTQKAFLASLADLRNQLHVVSQRCKQTYRDIEDEDSAVEIDPSELGHLAVSAATVQESYQAKQNISQMRRYDAESALEEGGMYRAAPRSRALTWLRSVPVQIVALIMVAGLVYVLDPDILSDLASFSLTFTPELRHVNGPPPL